MPLTRLLVISSAVVLLAAAVAFSVPGIRLQLLRSAGWALVADDPLDKADVIIVATDASAAGLLEAAQLVKDGVAPQVAIFSYVADRAGEELARRGIVADDFNTLRLPVLQRLGVASVDIIPTAVVGTTDEGRVLRQWCAGNRIRSVIFISTTDHSRRTRRVMTRTFAATGIRVMVRYARFSEFNPDDWWKDRGGQRTEAVEAEKLLLDIISHPFS
jgi:hypothetical protein